MGKYSSIVLLLISFAAHSQPLRDINYEYVYNPNAQVYLQMKAVRNATSYAVLYNLHVKDTTRLMEHYSIEWEGRALLGDKEGSRIGLTDEAVKRHATGFRGSGNISIADAPRYLTAKVVDQIAKRAWLFYIPLEPNFPVDNYLVRNGELVTEPYVHTNEKVRLGSDGERRIVSYYDDNFPAAAPVFSEAQARVSRGMAVDSVFEIGGDHELSFPMKGLYLIQKDTNALEGLAFRSEEDYPQYSKVANLAGPLIYITTRQEYDRLEATQGNKKAFDRVVLSIAMDTERARILMRNYFRRVELANRYFTSYKEGWKTDRGMVYIVFGAPEQVLKFDNREVWSYKNDVVNASFTFSKSTSLFDPDNFVLIRDKKYENTWYEVIDLWRNARF